jgi:hypothetical protein
METVAGAVRRGSVDGDEEGGVVARRAARHKVWKVSGKRREAGAGGGQDGSRTGRDGARRGGARGDESRDDRLK